jgi:hypothetical protein
VPPWDRYAATPQSGNPSSRYIIPPAGPKPATNYQNVAGGGQAYIPGSAADPASITRTRAAELAADPRVGVDIARTQLAMQKDQVDLQKAPAEQRKAIADAAKAEADLAKAQQEAAAAANGGINPNDPKMKAIVAQLLKAEDAYARTIKGGWPNPIAGRFPTAENTAFESIGSGLAEIGNAAFRVPGQGTQSDADAARFAAANQPFATDTEAALEAKFGNMRTRLQANGITLPAPVYQQGAQQQGVTNGTVAPGGSNNNTILPLAGGAGSTGANPPPAGPTAPTITLATGSTRNEADPQASALIDAGIRSGLTDEQINASLKAIGFNQTIDAKQSEAARAYLAANPGYTGSFGGATREVVNSQLAQAAASPIGTYFTNAADALSAGTLDNLTADPAAARRGLELSNAQNPTAALLGAISGGALAAGGVELGLGAGAARLGAGAASRLLTNPITADAAYGAAYGAGSTDEGSRLLGAGLGAGAGVAGGMFGRGVTRGLGNATRGVRNDAVQYLRDRNIPLTFGQTVGQSGVLGRAIQGAENRLSGLSGVGDVVGNRYREGIQAFNREAFDQGLAPIGAGTGGVIGEAGIDAGRALRSQAYDDALGGVNTVADQPFVADMTATLQAGRALPDPMAGNADYTLNTRIGNSFGPNGELSGRDFQQAIRGLRRDASSVANQPYGYDFGQVARQGEDALTGLLERQAPGAVPAYQAANAANRNLEVLRSAVDRAKNTEGTFSPAQLAMSASQNSRRFGNTQGTTDQPFFELSRAAQAVLPNKVPDSGTAGRLATLGGLGLVGGVGAGAGYAGGDTSTGLGSALLAGGTLAAGGSRAGQRALTRLVAERPDRFVRIGDQIYDRARIGGMFGAGLGAAAIPSLLPAQ